MSIQVQTDNEILDLYGDNGYIGDWICDGEGKFGFTPPIIYLDFSESFPDVIPGITITWSTAFNEWAKSFQIFAYHNEQVIFRSTVSDNKDVISIVNADIRGYTRIIIRILEWSSPLHRARIESIFLGINKVYTKSEIARYTSSMFVDPLSAELPNSEIQFEVFNLDGEYNPDNPKGSEKYLMERQLVTVRYGYSLDNSIEWISGGVYYLSEWKTPQNGITATFTARDSMELMTDVYDQRTVSGTLMDVAEACLQQADITHYHLDDSLSNINLPSTGVDFNNLTIAEVLQYISNAGCCAFWQDRQGYVNIKKIDTTSLMDYQINQDNSYENSEISLSKQLKAIDINRGQFYLTVGLNGETQPLENSFIDDEQAPYVAKWVMDYLVNRRTVSGEFRADPRLDPLDVITNQNQFASSIVVVTNVNLTYNGAFRGSYTGRAANRVNDRWYYAGNQIHAGEIGIYGYDYR